MSYLIGPDGHLNWAILSPAIIVLTALVFMGLEHVLPFDRGQKLFRKGWFTDFFWYTLLQSYVLGLGIQALAHFLDEKTGRPRWVADWPLWSQVVLFLLAHDLYIYWFHRAMHRWPVLWRLHEAHHSVKEVDWLAGSRSHPLEIIINQSIEFIPIVLFASPELFLIKGTIDAVWGMFIHANVNVRGWLFQYVINGPEMHRWHHSKEYTGYGFNYGTKLAFWDWIFGTAFVTDRNPPAYGLADPFPDGYFKQVAFAFRPFEPPAPTPSESAGTTP